MLLGGATAWPLTARAQSQQPVKVYRIAIVHPSTTTADMSETGDDEAYSALFKELRRLGYVEGQNLVVERYSGEGRTEPYVELARDVVRQNPDMILVNGGRVVQNFKAATATIPIVGITADPVPLGIVATLARPGGNITGVSVNAGSEIWGKRLQLLREVIPTTSKVGWLASRQVWELPEGSVIALREAARHAGISLLGPPLESPIRQQEYRRAFEAMAKEHADALIVSDQGEHNAYRRLIVDLAQTASLPTVYPYRAFVEIGGLVSYGPSHAAVYRRAAGYVDRILQGENPGEIPIYLESKFELVVNLKSAKSLGLTVPPTLLATADKVIE